MVKDTRLWYKLPYLPLRLLLVGLCAWVLYTISTGLIPPSILPTTTFPRKDKQQLNSWQVQNNRPLAASETKLQQSIEKYFNQDSKHDVIQGRPHSHLTKKRAQEQDSLEYYVSFKHQVSTQIPQRSSIVDILPQKSKRFNNRRKSLVYRRSQKRYRNITTLNYMQRKGTESVPFESIPKLKRDKTSNGSIHASDKSNAFQESSAINLRESEKYLHEDVEYGVHYAPKYTNKYGFSSKHKYAKPFFMMKRNQKKQFIHVDYNQGINQEITHASHISDRLSGIRTILLWTSLDDGWNFLPMKPSAFSNCSEIRCEMTSDRSRLKDSHAVLFHVRTMSLLDLPPVRLPHQKWIFFSLEPPPQSYFPGFHFMHRMFNWTMTYRNDSDIVIPYGRVIPSTLPQNNSKSRKEWELLWKMKTRPVIWMVSHCDTYSKRELYVRQLQKFIDVDILGGCGTAVCLYNQTNKCLKAFSRRYKFFLAFENSVCDDYVTEKFFRALKYDIIPVVLGGADYKTRAPPDSYISAADYHSPKELADYLHRVSENFTLYRKYLKWKDVGYIIEDEISYCALCQKVHSQDIKAKSTYKNMVTWWVDNSHCTKWTSR